MKVLSYNNRELLISERGVEGVVNSSAPSNIALVKYWGKKGVQLPINPSVSFTLNSSLSNVELKYEKSENGLELEFSFEGVFNPKFRDRVYKYLVSLFEIYPFLNQLKLKIDSKNSFPHSAGIASSASFYAALALALVKLEDTLFDTVISADEKLEKTSYLARLGSGSGARSVYPGVVLWGECEFKNSSDYHATPIGNIHETFLLFSDSILIVDDSVKSVSSSLGHQLMNDHSFKEMRIKNAKRRVLEMVCALQNGDVDSFGRLLEEDALELHGLMMSSTPPYILMRPNSLAVLEKIKEFRTTSKVPCYFTLDAGPNIHLLYPSSYKSEVKKFIEAELLDCVIKSWIDDRVCYEF